MMKAMKELQCATIALGSLANIKGSGKSGAKGKGKGKNHKYQHPAASSPSKGQGKGKGPASVSKKWLCRMFSCDYAQKGFLNNAGSHRCRWCGVLKAEAMSPPANERIDKPSISQREPEAAAKAAATKASSATSKAKAPAAPAAAAPAPKTKIMEEDAEGFRMTKKAAKKAKKAEKKRAAEKEEAVPMEDGPEENAEKEITIPMEMKTSFAKFFKPISLPKGDLKPFTSMLTQYEALEGDPRTLSSNQASQISELKDKESDLQKGLLLTTLSAVMLEAMRKELKEVQEKLNSLQKASSGEAGKAKARRSISSKLEGLRVNLATRKEKQELMDAKLDKNDKEFRAELATQRALLQQLEDKFNEDQKHSKEVWSSRRKDLETNSKKLEE